MRVTASHIVEWANAHAKQAQTELPRLVRRLCFLSGSTRQLAFPAGDSTYSYSTLNRCYQSEAEVRPPLVDFQKRLTG